MFFKNLKHWVKKKKENSHELQASINGKKSINVLLFASFTFFLISTTTAITTVNGY